MKLSVIVPGIRPQNWLRLFNSIVSSLEDTDFEVIFIGPNNSDDTKDLPNVKFIKDWGSPARCMNIGLVNAEGTYITWAADDGWFLPGQLKNIFYRYELALRGRSTVVTSYYLEGSGDNMRNEDYYKIKNSLDCTGLHIDPDYWLLNIGVIHRNFLLDRGGWNGYAYQTSFVSHLDLAVRLQADGHTIFKMHQEPLFACDHMPGESGDHAPIHHAHYEDIEVFRKKYSSWDWSSEYLYPDNWTYAPAKWERRFA